MANGLSAEFGEVFINALHTVHACRFLLYYVEHLSHHIHTVMEFHRVDGSRHARQYEGFPLLIPLQTAKSVLSIAKRVTESYINASKVEYEGHDTWCDVS